MTPEIAPLFETYFDRYVIKGGIVMIALIPCSILLVGATIQALLRLRRGRVAPPALLAEAKSASTGGERAKLLAALAAGASPLAVAAGQVAERFPPENAAPPRDQIESAAGEAIAHAADDMYDALNIFSTLYTVAPLLGLLGTILGMIHAFEVFGSQTVQDLKFLSDGIQEALITTLWGLFIAIPAYIAAQHFQGRVRRYEREELPEEIMPLLDAVYYPGSGGSNAASIRAAEEGAARDRAPAKETPDSWIVEGDQP